MASIGTALLQELAVLSQGRNPVYEAQDEVLSGATPAPPELTDDGIDLQDGVLAMVKVKLRRNAAYQSFWVTITSVAASTGYRVTIAGTNYTYTSDGDDTATVILNGLAAAMAADANVDAVVDGTTLKITGKTAANYTASTSITTGSGTMSGILDATSVDFEVWTLDNEGDWCRVNNGVFEGVDANWKERLVCAGDLRGFIRITSTDGRVVASIGPCLLES